MPVRLRSRKLTGRTRLTRSFSPESCEARHGFYVLLCISRRRQKFWQGSIEMASGQESWQQGTRMERMGESCKVWNQSSLWCMVNKCVYLLLSIRLQLEASLIRRKLKRTSRRLQRLEVMIQQDNSRVRPRSETCILRPTRFFQAPRSDPCTIVVART